MSPKATPVWGLGLLGLVSFGVFVGFRLGVSGRGGLAFGAGFGVLGLRSLVFEFFGVWGFRLLGSFWVGGLGFSIAVLCSWRGVP